MPALELIAHRGYRRQHPENSLSAIRAAVECGAQFVEIDVHLTADHIPILIHDDTFDRVCGLSGSVHQKTYEELPAYLASESSPAEPIASLGQCCQILLSEPEVHLFVEIKKAAAEHFGESLVVERVLNELQPIIPRCTIISFSSEILREVERQSQVAFGLVVRQWSERVALEDFQRRPQVLFCDLKGLPASGDLAMEGTELAVFEVGDIETALKLSRRGVAYAETFHVCELLAELESGKHA